MIRLQHKLKKKCIINFKTLTLTWNWVLYWRQDQQLLRNSGCVGIGIKVVQPKVKFNDFKLLEECKGQFATIKALLRDASNGKESLKLTKMLYL